MTVTISSVTGLPGLSFETIPMACISRATGILWLLSGLRHTPRQRFLFRRHQRDCPCLCFWLPTNG